MSSPTLAEAASMPAGQPAGELADSRTVDSRTVLSAAEAQALNELVVAFLDNADEYRRAIFSVEQLLERLHRRLFDRVHAVERLQSLVRASGAQPATSRSALAAVFAARLAAPQPFMSHNHEDFLRDVAHGEQALKERFKRYLTATRLSPMNHECVSNLFDRITTEGNRTSEGWSRLSNMVSSNSLLASDVQRESDSNQSDGASITVTAAALESRNVFNESQARHSTHNLVNRTPLAKSRRRRAGKGNCI